MTTATQGRRSRWAALIAVLVALVAVGGTYALINSRAKASAATAQDATSAQIQEGKNLFLEGCSSCHGINAQGIDGDTKAAGGNGGPSLIGVGAAAVHFQVSTGRMPLAGPGAQAVVRPPIYNEQEIDAMAAYIASMVKSSFFAAVSSTLARASLARAICSSARAVTSWALAMASCSCAWRSPMLEPK